MEIGDDGRSGSAIYLLAFVTGKILSHKLCMYSGVAFYKVLIYLVQYDKPPQKLSVSPNYVHVEQLNTLYFLNFFQQIKSRALCFLLRENNFYSGYFSNI